MKTGRGPDESGLTLIELIVAVAIMSIAFVFFVNGMLTSIFGSDIHRRQATTDTILKTVAETAQKATYHDCTTTPATDYGLTVPSGYVLNVAVAYGDATSSSFYTPPPACATDNGLQKLTITVSDTTGRDAEGPVDVVKRKTT